MNLTIEQEILTPPEIARLLNVKPGKVLAWIKSGELAAADVSERRDGLPRYKVARADLQAFLKHRAAVPLPERKPRRRPTSAQPYQRKYY